MLTAGLLVLVLCGVVVLACGIGAVRVAPLDVLTILARPLGLHLPGAPTVQQEAVVAAIRLPRVALGVLVGASLACAGAAMQGLFRNPLADPGVLGVSSGAALGAVSWIVLGGEVLSRLAPPQLGLPLAAALGCLLAVTLIHRLAAWCGGAGATLLLAGIAVNAVASAATGWLTFLADDVQLRALTFWTLGSLGRADWGLMGTIAPLLGGALLLLPGCARGLNALALGETEAGHLGVSVPGLRRALIVLVSIAVGTAVAVSGVIAFVGLIVPQALRLWLGPDHRRLLPASALAGATLMVVADVVARTAAAPAEVPIGIITAGLGGPFFLWMLLRMQPRATP
jgi:iron complex transport system permease protein